MNYDEIYAKLMSVANALNTVETHGRTSLLNLAGAINVIEDVAKQIKEADPRNGSGGK